MYGEFSRVHYGLDFKGPKGANVPGKRTLHSQLD